ncbi:MAG: transporter, partial [Armatimonadetes bacterium]|nr:transporter [Armatimonadota bacterium]
MLTLVSLGAFLLHFAAGVVGPDPISTDRPDFTEGSRAVPVGVFQFESGMTYEELDGPGNATSIGEALIRYGFQAGSELRIALPSHVSLDGTGADVTGFGDLAIGFKHELNGDEEVEFALLGQVAFPTGVAGLRTARTTPMAAFIWGTESGGTSYGGQIQAEWPGGRTDLRHTFVAGFPVGERLGAFAEHVVDFGETMAPAHILHFGLTFQPDRDTQWDFH